MATRTSQKSGLWSDPTVWSGGVVPLNTEPVIIAAGHQIEFDVNQTAMAAGIAGLTINAGASLFASLTPGTYVLKSSAAITGTGVLRVGTSAAVPYPANCEFTYIATATAARIGLTGTASYQLFCQVPAVKWVTTTQPALLGATTIYVDQDVSAWPLKSVRITRGTRASGYTVENKVLNGAYSDRITLTSGLAGALPVGSWIVLSYRNVRIANTALAIGFYNPYFSVGGNNFYLEIGGAASGFSGGNSPAAGNNIDVVIHGCTTGWASSQWSSGAVEIDTTNIIITACTNGMSGGWGPVPTVPWKGTMIGITTYGFTGVSRCTIAGTAKLYGSSIGFYNCYGVRTLSGFDVRVITTAFLSLSYNMNLTGLQTSDMALFMSRSGAIRVTGGRICGSPLIQACWDVKIFGGQFVGAGGISGYVMDSTTAEVHGVEFANGTSGNEGDWGQGGYGQDFMTGHDARVDFYGCTGQIGDLRQCFGYKGIARQVTSGDFVPPGETWGVSLITWNDYRVVQLDNFQQRFTVPPRSALTLIIKMMDMSGSGASYVQVHDAGDDPYFTGGTPLLLFPLAAGNMVWQSRSLRVENTTDIPREIVMRAFPGLSYGYITPYHGMHWLAVTDSPTPNKMMSCV